MGLSNLSSASMGLRSLYTFSAAGHGPSSPSRYLFSRTCCSVWRHDWYSHVLSCSHRGDSTFSLGVQQGDKQPAARAQLCSKARAAGAIRQLRYGTDSHI